MTVDLVDATPNNAHKMCKVKGIEFMAAILPAPSVSELGPDNVIDLGKLGSADLQTWVNYPGIAEGDLFWPTWWGCTALGEAVDDFNELEVIGPGELEPSGKSVLISNGKLKALDQGWVFYSYRMNDPSLPGGKGEESLRLFFYVGKRSSTLPQLPVIQFKESHDLAVDPASIGPAGATLVTLPYQAMAVDDVVALTLAMYFDDGSHYESIQRTKILVKADIGKPLQWPPIPKGEFEIIADGFAHMSYSVVYATPTVPSESALQTVYVINPTEALLPLPEIRDLVGDELDPDAFPDGITLSIPLYPGIQIGDDVLVYASGDTSLIKYAHVDPSTIDSATLEVTLEYAWLLANNGKAVEFVYQYARAGSAGTSSPLTVTLRKPLKLPAPIVEGVAEDHDGNFYLLASSIARGLYIKVPEEAIIGVDDKVQMHWDGCGSTGTWIADPTEDDPKRFLIPPTAVPANMGKHLMVFYKVTPPGKDSAKFDLLIKDMTSGWPTLQIQEPRSPSNQVSLAAVTTNVIFSLDSWTYMAAGQRLKIVVKGSPLVGPAETFDLRTGDAEVVTEAEVQAKKLEAKLPRAFLEILKLNLEFNVEITVSFDGGGTYKYFPAISPMLIA